MNKINSVKYYRLQENVTYGLGIVTGNNTQYLNHSFQQGLEPIISEKNLKKYFVDYDSIDYYIDFQREKLQQVAPNSLYRAQNKLLYKFIGNKLVFSIDTKQYLSLNSANVISFPESFDIYYIAAILNSRITQLFFDEKYQTIKVLKNHIQSFHIPIVNENVQEEIRTLLKDLSLVKRKYAYIEEIETKIYSIFGLTEKEIYYLKERYS